MSYLSDFQERLEGDDYAGFLQLWEEYCEIDEVDVEECKAILKAILDSRLAARFGKFAESALHLWQKVPDPEKGWGIFRLILDLETTHSPELAEITFRMLQQRYGQERHFHEKIRLIGLRGRDDFRGAVRNYELLSHLVPGAFVYHTGGWGTGEVMEVSLTREDLVLEFEGVPGLRSVPFENAFSNFIPLSKDHFLARRFGSPDQLEEEARKDPVAVVRLLLRDLGPKTAAEMKDELSDLVIPADEWTKWWQSTRSKIKRDTMIETPSSVRKPFRLRQEEVSHGDRLFAQLEPLRDPAKMAMTIYNFIRDFPEVMREADSSALVRKRLLALSQEGGLSDDLALTVTALIDELFPKEAEQSLDELVGRMENLVEAIEAMEIPAFKKRVLVAIREVRADWVALFLKALFVLPQSMLRDYLLHELEAPEAKERLVAQIVELIQSPDKNPSLFVWYFQKAIAHEESEEELPYGGEKEAQCDLFEAFLTLLHLLERSGDQRDLIKKMYSLFCNDRYLIVRNVLEGSSLPFAQEFLLLASKCRTFSDHDLKILQSLAGVAHPSLVSGRGEEEMAKEELLWTTEAGYHKVQERLRELGTVEAIKNAREVEEARAHGDLRENADYKGALERRHRIQAEMKSLSSQIRHARILSASDVSKEVVGVGSVVELVDGKGEKKRYTLLGPWEADPEKGILSSQSRFAKSMFGQKQGGRFSFQGEDYLVHKIESFFDQ